MPILPAAFHDLPKNVGYITRLLVGRCAPDPFLLLETATRAFVKAALDIAEPDLKEALHKLSGNSMLHHIRMYAEDAEVAEDELGGKVLKHLFRIGAAADLGIWTAFLAGVGSEAIIDFTSQLMKISPCLHHYPPYCGYGYDNIGASYVGGWNPMGEFAITMPSVFGPIWPPVYNVDRDHFVTIGWWGTPSDFYGNPCGAATRLLDTTTGVILEHAENELSEDGSYTSLAGWVENVPVKAGHSLTIQGMGTSPTPLNEVFWSRCGCWIAPSSGD